MYFEMNEPVKELDVHLEGGSIVLNVAGEVHQAAIVLTLEEVQELIRKASVFMPGWPKHYEYQQARLDSIEDQTNEN